MNCNLLQAKSLDEALEARRRFPEARWLAGGTSLIPDQNLGRLTPSGYISLRRIPELSRIEALEDVLFVGAACTMAAIGSHPAVAGFAPMLAKAARTMATRQVRSRASLGGNIATLRSDRSITPCLLALDAQLHILTASGTGQPSLEDYLSAERVRPESTPSPIVMGASIPRARGFQDFTRIGLNNGASYPIVVTALVVDPVAQSVRLGLGGAGPVACRAHQAEAFAQASINWQSLTLGDPESFGAIAARECDPPEDASISSAYRRHAIQVMSKRLMEQAGTPPL